MNTRALVLVVGAAVAGCGKSAPSSTARPGAAQVGSADTAAASDVPVDHLAPGELVEGTEKAFGLTLPRGLTVDQRLPGVVTASGPVGPQPLVTYLRARLEGGAIRQKDGATTFEHVKPAGQAAGPALEIYVTRLPAKTLVQLVSAPDVPPSTLPDEPSRWRAAGLTPQGKVLDPSHTE